MAAAVGSLSFLAEMEADAQRAAARGVNKWARRVLATAKRNAPLGPPLRNDGGQFRARELGEIHPGHLRDSGYVEEVAETVGANPYDFARVIFDAVYAAAIHENVDWKHPQGGMAKYLEAAFKQHLPELPAVVGAEINVEMEKR